MKQAQKTTRREQTLALRAKIAAAISAWIRAHDLTQAEAARHLGMYQFEVHHLRHAKFGRVTAERLLNAWMRIGGEWEISLDGSRLIAVKTVRQRKATRA